MPASITHELIAEAALARLDAAARRTAHRAPAYYFLGAQGPDLFFFYRPLAFSQNLGRLLHKEHVYRWFQGLRAALEDFTGEAFEDCLAYAMGYVTHFAADVVFHPVVYRLAEGSGSARLAHQQIENHWDVWFLRHIRGLGVKEYSFPFDLAPIREDGVLFRYLCTAAGTLGIPLSERAFSRTLRLFSLYLKHFHSARTKLLHYAGRARFSPQEIGADEVVRGEKLRTAAGGTEDIEELFMRAVEKSGEGIRSFLDAFNAGAPLPEAFFSVHLLTGKPLRETGERG